MTDPNELPDWLHEGAELAIVRRSAREWELLNNVTATRILTRDIVLDNGERFNRKYLNSFETDAVRKPSPHAYGSPAYLVQRSDPRVLEAHANRAMNRAMFAVDDAYDVWRKDRTSDAALAQIVSAASALQQLRNASTKGDAR